MHTQDTSEELNRQDAKYPPGGAKINIHLILGVLGGSNLAKHSG